MYYAGIGSRETPQDTLHLMNRIAAHLARQGYTLRSGGAGGADTAFEAGCDAAAGQKQIFIPWSGFSGRRAGEPGVHVGVGPNALALAERMHPNWSACSRGARALHARNGYQVLGPKLDTPVDFVVCWTPQAHRGGGTGQALRIAESHGITIYDLADVTALAHWTAIAS